MTCRMSDRPAIFEPMTHLRELIGASMFVTGLVLALSTAAQPALGTQNAILCAVGVGAVIVGYTVANYGDPQ